MNLQQAYDQNDTTPRTAQCCGGTQLAPAQSCGRPFPTVRRLSAGRRHEASSRTALIAVSQRDDTVVLRAGEARRLARALIRAAGRR
jgi:hypothetical protein